MLFRHGMKMKWTNRVDGIDPNRFSFTSMGVDVRTRTNLHQHSAFATCHSEPEVRLHRLQPDLQSSPQRWVQNGPAQQAHHRNRNGVVAPLVEKWASV
jgi:hypothetical protein